ncbi:hypothetical protein NT6N_18690 [Oceaniferula spumae]|uniref:Band 7 domain-containing protein n=1 Tax=Oceaniferula spumae TaxID=2979115 RepID=A0AAT9FLL2_9BACT
MIIPKTIPDGQAVIRWNRNGTRDIITGPVTLFAPFAKIKPIHQVTANESEYLVINFCDGHTEHRAGPCAQWFDPLLHQNITPRKATALDAHEAIVIYNEADGEVTHRILHGPAIYIPTPTENLHQFRWHGDNGKGRKVPRALQFEKLRVIPDQMYFDVDGVRTADEALITAKLMVFFELIDIEKMLQETHDPIADFINALTADVIKFAGKFDFEAFKTRASQLNKLETYQALTKGAERIGYRISKVVYRGYAATDKLQAMHDNAIETRTRLVLETEIEHQQQELTDLKQTREHERAAEQRQEEERTQQHLLDQTKKQHQQDLAFKKELQANEKAHQEELLHLQQEEWNHLKTLGTDLTAVLVAKEHNPDKTIRLDGNAQHPLHLHEAI